jgi:hypothetical protein
VLHERLCSKLLGDANMRGLHRAVRLTIVFHRDLPDTNSGTV